MPQRIPVIRILEVLLALVYGVILGSRLPIPGPRAIYALAPVAAVPVSALAAPDAAGELSIGELGLADEVRPLAAARAPRNTGTALMIDTLPGAPARTVLQVAAPAGAPGGPAASRSMGTGCIGAEGADDEACRAAVRARLRSLCPRPGDLTHRGAIVCIREED